MMAGEPRARLHALWCHGVVRASHSNASFRSLRDAHMASRHPTTNPELYDYRITPNGARIAHDLFTKEGK